MACRAGGVDLSFWRRGTDFEVRQFADAADRIASDPYTVVTPLKDPSPYEDYIPKDSRFNDGGLVSMPVGQYSPNAWGLHDMHGNVWEWTRTSHRPYPYRDDDGRNALDAVEKKVVRGGSWRDRPHRATAACRLAYEPWQRVFNVGFRIVCEDESPVSARAKPY